MLREAWPQTAKNQVTPLCCFPKPSGPEGSLGSERLLEGAASPARFLQGLRRPPCKERLGRRREAPERPERPLWRPAQSMDLQGNAPGRLACVHRTQSW